MATLRRMIVWKIPWSDCMGIYSLTVHAGHFTGVMRTVMLTSNGRGVTFPGPSVKLSQLD